MQVTHGQNSGRGRGRNKEEVGDEEGANLLSTEV